MNDNVALNEGDLNHWVQKALEKEDILNYTVHFKGTSSIGDGFVGDIKYLHVKGNRKDGKETEYNLVIKHGKDNEKVRQMKVFSDFFQREIDIYSKVVPFFEKFQKEKGVDLYFNSLPKCYGTFFTDRKQGLVFENLRALGYEPCERDKAISSNHITLVLKKYAIWHALSLSARKQRKEKFLQITANWTDLLLEYFSMPNVDQLINEGFELVSGVLEATNELELLEKFRTQFSSSYFEHLVELLRAEDNSQFVITHRDCWISNFLFKYEDPDKNCPSEVAILDWQVSKLASPVCDISYFLYANCSEDDLQRLEELLTMYYHELAKNIEHLGDHPEELFSFSDFKQHWEKYSKYAILFMPMTLKIILTNKEDIDFDAVPDEKMLDSAVGKNAKYDQNMYEKRILAVIKNYYNFKF